MEFDRQKLIEIHSYCIKEWKKLNYELHIYTVNNPRSGEDLNKVNTMIQLFGKCNSLRKICDAIVKNWHDENALKTEFNQILIKYQQIRQQLG